MPSNPKASTPGPVATRDLTATDFAAVADQQVAAFPSNVWSRLGGRLLLTYLRLFLESPHAVALAPVDERGRSPAGGGPTPPIAHMLGILDTGAHRRWVLRHGAVRLALALPAAAARHPLLMAGLVRRRVLVLLRRARSARSAGDGAATPDGPVAVLSHVTVHPTRRGEGLGQVLVDEFLDRARRSGAAYAGLATLDEEGAGAWYEARGWKLDVCRKTFDGRWIRIYCYPL